MITFAPKILEKHSGCSAVRLAYLLWEQRVAGSNPATPTLKMKFLFQNGKLFLNIFFHDKIFFSQVMFFCHIISNKSLPLQNRMLVQI